LFCTKLLLGARMECAAIVVVTQGNVQ